MDLGGECRKSEVRSVKMKMLSYSKRFDSNRPSAPSPSRTLPDACLAHSCRLLLVHLFGYTTAEKIAGRQP